MTTETKWHLPPLRWHGMTNAAVSLLPLVNTISSRDTLCFTISCSLFKPNQAHNSETPSSSASSVLLTINLFVRSINLFTQLPICHLYIMSNQLGRRRRQLKLRSGSSGLFPIVLLFTWSMWWTVSHTMQVMRGLVQLAQPAPYLYFS